MSDTNNMSNATLIKWNDAKPNAELLRIRSDGSFEIQKGAPTLFVLGELVHAFLKQQDRIRRLEEAGDKMEAWLRDERLDAVQHTVSKWNKAKEDKP